MTILKNREPIKSNSEMAKIADIFGTQLELRKQGKLSETIFAETRLRHGVYGQRYDNGQRHDGTQTRSLDYPSDLPTKGPETLWDAPGMQRIKLPFGGVNPEQLELLADLAEEYADEVIHITTRQDVQLHYVHIEDTPALMKRLAEVGITTLEACGNVVRNVTACPMAGVSSDEVFDVTPYAQATSKYMLGHPDFQDFGRKFKVSFSGSAEKPGGLAAIHDMGLIAKTRVENGVEQRGFTLLVGGGLGAVPYQAKLFTDFLPEQELLPTARAIARLFGRLGEKKNRARARLKFLVDKLGIEEFRRLVQQERQSLPNRDWPTDIVSEFAYTEQPLHRLSQAVDETSNPDGFKVWHQSNVNEQKQAGYAAVTVALPLGDISAWQLRELARIGRHFVGDHIRVTVEQNILLRWVRQTDLSELYRQLKEVGLGEHGAGTITDITTCPGTDTCKLGIASSRGLTEELRSQLNSQYPDLTEAVKELRIKISGCFNACGQHHIADIGFYGVSRTIGVHKVPHFQVVLGGTLANNAGSFGMAIGAVPSQNIPKVVKHITERFQRERDAEESFRAFIQRIGKKVLRADLEGLMTVPAHDDDPSFYSDWGDPREYTLDDLGTGECAGQVVTPVQFGLAAAERKNFEAQLYLDDGKYLDAWHGARDAMLQAAKTLVREKYRDISNEPEEIVNQFRKRFYDTKLFFDKYAGGKFANYLFRHYLEVPGTFTSDAARQSVEEAQLFIEGAYVCHTRLVTQKIPENGTLSKLNRAALAPSRKEG